MQDFKTDTSPLWSLSGIRFNYSKTEVLQDINLKLFPGRCYGILGPNGSGKTTLLDILAGVLKPVAGTVTFQGKPLNQWPKKQLARVLGLVPQDFMVRFGFTVREAVEMGLHPHMSRFATPSEADLALINKALQETGISAMADRPITQLSGGEKQRVALARTLAQNPNVLLLDEATSNLDIHHSLEILRLIRQRYEKKDIHVVAVMHDLNLASFFCDELIFIKHGKIVYQGTTDTTLTPDVIADVYEVESEVVYNHFTNCRQVSFRLPMKEKQC